MSVKLYGRAFLNGFIKAETGLHIGAGATEMAIGAIDNTVIRDPLTRVPYIPGSSLKGKMRSLSERGCGKPMNWPNQSPIMHACQDQNKYRDCSICNAFGVPAKADLGLTRLIVRDVPLHKDYIRVLDEAKIDLYTEIKYEVAINRITSEANPRPMERVPAGAIFGPMELSFAFYEPQDIDRLDIVFQAMHLLEEDYLGGQGSRGSGKVKFLDLTISCRAGENWGHKPTWITPEKKESFTLDAFRENPAFLNDLKVWLRNQLFER